jgi:hypothetical protein
LLYKKSYNHQHSNMKLDYAEQRDIKILANGKIVVVKPLIHSVITPLFCEVCEYPMKTSDDSAAYKMFGCCDRCALKFAFGNKEKWEKGWRPTSEDLKEYKEERELLAKPLLILR